MRLCDMLAVIPALHPREPASPKGTIPKDILRTPGIAPSLLKGVGT